MIVKGVTCEYEGEGDPKLPYDFLETVAKKSKLPYRYPGSGADRVTFLTNVSNNTQNYPFYLMLFQKRFSLGKFLAWPPLKTYPRGTLYPPGKQGNRAILRFSRYNREKRYPMAPGGIG